MDDSSKVIYNNKQYTDGYYTFQPMIMVASPKNSTVQGSEQDLAIIPSWQEWNDLSERKGLILLQKNHRLDKRLQTFEILSIYVDFG